MKYLLSIVFLMVSLPALAWDNCKEEGELEYELDVKSATKMILKAGAGKLEVRGKDDLEGIRIRAKLCAPDKEQLEELDILAQVKGNKVAIETVIPKGGWMSDKSSSIDLQLYIPEGFDVNAKDSSGAALVVGVRSLVMEDSSGELVIRDVENDVDVSDSSGALKIANVGGTVRVNDSSGLISVKSIGEDFIVESDSSGAIEGKNINGNYIVLMDSSGSIDAKNVGGDFQVKVDGSGGITYKNIGGRVDTPK